MKHDHEAHGGGEYKAGSITLGGAVAMGTGVMIGAGIFALTGQIAELAGPWFPLSFLLGALIAGFSACAASACRTPGLRRAASR